jgi:hypothetical protein
MYFAREYMPEDFEEKKVLVSIDVNGILNRNRAGRNPYQMTTGRGLRSGPEKLFETGSRMQSNLRGRGSGKSSAVVFQNIVSHGVWRKSELMPRLPYTDSGLLCFSAALARSLTESSFIDSATEWGLSAGVRPFVNEYSSGGGDWTILPIYILGLFGSGMGDSSWWMSLTEPDGHKYVADSSGYDLVMVGKLSHLLRGITPRNADRLASFAKSI